MIVESKGNNGGGYVMGVEEISEGGWRAICGGGVGGEKNAPNVVYKGNRSKCLQNEGARRELFESRGECFGRGE